LPTLQELDKPEKALQLTTFSKTTLSIKKSGITENKTRLSAEWQTVVVLSNLNAERHLRCVKKYASMLRIIMLSVVLLGLLALLEHYVQNIYNFLRDIKLPLSFHAIVVKSLVDGTKLLCQINK
jgi:hypothetical protein